MLRYTFFYLSILWHLYKFLGQISYSKCPHGLYAHSCIKAEESHSLHLREHYGMLQSVLVSIFKCSSVELSEIVILKKLVRLRSSELQKGSFPVNRFECISSKTLQFLYLVASVFKQVLKVLSLYY